MTIEMASALDGVQTGRASRENDAGTKAVDERWKFRHIEVSVEPLARYRATIHGSYSEPKGNLS